MKKTVSILMLAMMAASLAACSPTTTATTAAEVKASDTAGSTDSQKTAPSASANSSIDNRAPHYYYHRFFRRFGNGSGRPVHGIRIGKGAGSIGCGGKQRGQRKLDRLESGNVQLRYGRLYRWSDQPQLPYGRIQHRRDPKGNPG